jgi:hypothetical protein
MGEKPGKTGVKNRGNAVSGKIRGFLGMFELVRKVREKPGKRGVFEWGPLARSHVPAHL